MGKAKKIVWLGLKSRKVYLLINQSGTYKGSLIFILFLTSFLSASLLSQFHSFFPSLPEYLTEPLPTGKQIKMILTEPNVTGFQSKNSDLSSTNLQMSSNPKE